jgi:RAP1 GTPase activating protein 1
MVMRAFSRLGSLTAGWGRSGRKSSQQQQQLAAEDKKKWSSSQDCSQDNKDKDSGKDKPQLAVPRLSVCADAQKVDRTKLAQTEVRRVMILKPKNEC